MKVNVVFAFTVLFFAVSFSYTAANAQVVEKTKEAAVKTKDVTVNTTKKVGVVVTDALETAADKTKSAVDSAAGGVKSTSKTYGSHTVSVTENIAGQAYEGGRWFMVTTWDGTKWVAKRTWFPDKKQKQ